MKNDIQVSLVTVNYAHSEFIAQLAASLEQHAPILNYEWILVDNGSKRGEGKILKQIAKGHDNWHVIELAENIGFGGGNMEGAMFAQGKYIAFVNPDTKIVDGVFESLIELLESDTNIGLVAPRLKTFEGENIVSARRFPTLGAILKKRFFGKNSDIYDHSDECTSVDWVFGAFLCVERDFFLRMGGWDRRFFLFFEDADLCRRYWEQGKKVVLANNLFVYHNVSRLSGNDIWTSLRRKTAWIHLASFIKYTGKYLGKKLPKIYT